MFTTKKTIISALCVALGVVLPYAFHAIPNSGSILLPMHIPVLICGLIAGPLYGMFVGILTPVASNLISGMPPAAYLLSMVCELAVYGLASGLFIRFIQTRNRRANIILSLIASMILGRIAYGLMNMLIFRVGSYSMQIWLTSAFVTALPGILIQIFIIPILIFSLEAAKLIEN